MAGGTGGHVFPALVVAEALRKLDRPVVWLGTGKGIENRLVPAVGIPLEKIRVSGLRRKGLISWLLAPFKLSIAAWDALQVVRRCRPSVVLGMGGFAAGPGGIAAWLLRRPLVIHEQNAAAGLTNRLLAGLAREVLQAFPGSFSLKREVRTVGNPVRAEILALRAPQERLQRNTDDTDNQLLRVLILGGSQGALALNKAVPAGLALLDNQTQVSIWHQTGAVTLTETAESYQALTSIQARLEPFIDDMAEAYAWADVVICRSGALTVSELAAVGLGSVLVPYPGSVDDHQTLNARYLADAGAAVLIEQRDLTPERLAQELQAYIEDRSLVIDRATRARELAPHDATDQVVAACLAVERAA